MSVTGSFHDYLGLSEAGLPRQGLLVFRGRSGSGKTTYIEWLLRARPEIVGRERDAGGGRVTVIDEVLRLRDLVPVAAAVRRSRLTLVASHLPGPLHHLLRPLGPVRVFDLDRQPGKLRHWLEEREIPAGRTPASGRAALAAFRRRFGANYTDAAIVLERAPGLPFDRAFARFTRRARIRKDPCPEDAFSVRVIDPSKVPTASPRGQRGSTPSTMPR